MAHDAFQVLTVILVALAMTPALKRPTWTTLRARWEWSHVARAALASVAFVALLVAIV